MNRASNPLQLARQWYMRRQILVHLHMQMEISPLDEKRLIQEFHQLLLGYDEHRRKRLSIKNDKT